MLDLAKINEVALKAASATLEGAQLDVRSTATTDSDGHEALHVTVVLRSGSSKDVDGDRALDTIVRIQRDLRNSGEVRYPIIEFVTNDELEADAGTQS